MSEEPGTRIIDWVVKILGSPGILVDETTAKTTPCKCYDVGEGELMCFSKGIIGTLSDKQEELYCPTKEIVEQGIAERVRKFREAVDVCKEEIKKIPKGERLEPWLTCMGKEAKARAIEI